MEDVKLLKVRMSLEGKPEFLNVLKAMPETQRGADRGMLSKGRDGLAVLKKRKGVVEKANFGERAPFNLQG